MIARLAFLAVLSALPTPSLAFMATVGTPTCAKGDVLIDVPTGVPQAPRQMVEKCVAAGDLKEPNYGTPNIGVTGSAGGSSSLSVVRIQ